MEPLNSENELREGENVEASLYLSIGHTNTSISFKVASNTIVECLNRSTTVTQLNQKLISG